MGWSDLFEHEDRETVIDIHNFEFEKQIMRELDADGEMSFCCFHEIYQNTQANIKNFLTLIKSQDLELQTPFLLKKACDTTF